MKNKTLLMLALAAVTFGWMSCSDAKKAETDWDAYELKGKVKTLTIKRYKAREAFGEVTKDELKSSEVVTFSKEGKIEHVFSSYYYSDEKSEYESFYTYTEKKTISEQYYNDDFSGKLITFYTDWGGKESEISYDESGDQSWATEYTYDDNHRLIERNHYYGKEFNSREKNFQYDEKGLVKSYKNYNNDGELTEISYYEYDAKGREVECTVEDGEGAVSYSIVHTYNDEGYTSCYKFVGTYYKNTEEYTYEYDKQGNYVVKYEMTKGGDTYICERTIVYY